MSIPSRTGKITEQQKFALLEYISSNKELQSGKFSQTFTFKRAQQCWQDMSEILNGIPGGAKKNWRQWRKTWHDMRTKTKSKNAAIKKYRDSTSGSAPPIEFLTPSEEKIIELIYPTSNQGHHGIVKSEIVHDVRLVQPSADMTEIASTSNDSPEEICAADIQNTLPSQPILQKKSIRCRKNFMQGFDISSKRNGIKNWYYHEKIKLMKEKIRLKRRQVAALERIADGVEYLVGSDSSFILSDE